MARKLRRVSETGIYHIVFRGVNHCHLFEEDEDFTKLLDLLASAKEDLSLEIYAYCLLDNHVHLLIREQFPGDIVKAMRKLLTPYAYWFNKKYLRSGALIANRYRSECVESDSYLLSLVRYIHQNPLIAGITKRMETYRYSSYGEYTTGRKGLTDTRLVIGMFADDHDVAIELFKSFHALAEDKDFSLPDRERKNEHQVRDEICSILGDVNPNALSGMRKAERDDLLVSLRNQGFSIRQIERVTGVSRGIIARSAKSKQADVASDAEM